MPQCCHQLEEMMYREPRIAKLRVTKTIAISVREKGGTGVNRGFADNAACWGEDSRWQ